MRRGIMVGALVCALASAGCGYACGFVGSADRVLQQQFSPEVMFERYQWFKDASAALDKKVADVRVYQGRLNRMKEDYGTNRRDWPRDVREQASIWESELAGVKASYNSLAAEYNAAMVKINFRFVNLGDLPPGATTPLPREYKPYIEE